MKHRYLEIVRSGTPGLVELVLRSLLICCVYAAFQNEACVVAADQVFTSEETLFGEIESVSTEAVRFVPRGSTNTVREIGVTDVVMIQYSDEPKYLIEAKKRLIKNDFGGAFEAIKKVSEDEIQSASVAVRSEYAYVRAVAAGHVAVDTTEGLSQALTYIEEVLDQFTRSIHYYDLLEAAGDLEGALGRYDKAAALYKKISRGPPPMVVRAERLQGNVLAAEGRHIEAIAEFENVQSVDLEGSFIEQEKMMACLGQAESLISLSRFDEAVSLISSMLAETYPEGVPVTATNILLGKAYSLLGQSLLETKEDQDALIAYLTVDLVYGDAPDTHAEALFRLFHLWNKGGYPRRAAEVRQRLIKAYPQSTWAAELNPSSK
ncbi:MAG: tetratricopeptide repeat protein [Pirellulales bacterium]|nr:tetratricopeptide repeat protein [Pirellulales bacterium]